tara:strand:- start:645 stop:1505 length:861 start_codon:yes stop_codon:yes gene_type:complete
MALSMEIYLHIGEDNVGPLSPEEVKAKHASGEVGPDTLGWMDTLDTWYPLSNEKFDFLGIASAAEPAPAAATEAPTASPAAEQPVADAAPASTEAVAAEASTEGQKEAAVQSQEEAVPDELEEEETEPEPDPAELAATSSAYDAASAFEPRSRDKLKAEMIRLKQEHDKVLLPEIGRKAVEEGIRVSGATEILNRIEAARKKGDSPQLQAAYVSYALAIVQGGLTDPALDDLLEQERRVSEDMLNLHTEAKGLADTPKPGGALKWVLLVGAVLALGGIVALVILKS